MADNSFRMDVAAIREFIEHAEEGREHAIRTAKRISQFGDTDVTTRRLMADILAEEEEHADDILDLLGSHADSS